MIARILIVLLLGVTPAWAGPMLDVPTEVLPGNLIIGRTDPGAAVTVGGEAVRVAPDGAFLVGIGRDEITPRQIVAHGEDGENTVAEVRILSRDYAIQRIDGLPQKTVTPDPETAERIGREIAAIAGVRTNDTPQAMFAAGFRWPVVGTVTGVYGSQRILNGEPRRPHFGVDVAAPTGTPIVAMGDGIVRLADDDMVLTGMTLMLDHGHGLMSVYTHMSEIAVTEGMSVAGGDMIGRVGATGRATGPHLHWGVTLFKTQLDPALVVGPMQTE